MFPDLTRDEVFMIGTRRLWLRWPRLDDAISLARIGGDVRIAANTASWPVGCDANYARGRIEKIRAGNAAGTSFAFVVARREAWGEAIGVMGFSMVADADSLVASGGYHLGPDHWGRGYASEALAGMVSMVRLLTRVDTLRASVMTHNAASARVLEKNGFSAVGDGRMATEHRGTFDVVHYERGLRRVLMPTSPAPQQRSAIGLDRLERATAMPFSARLASQRSMHR